MSLPDAPPAPSRHESSPQSETSENTEDVRPPLRSDTGLRLAAAASFLLLVVFGLFRSVLPDGIREHWNAVILALALTTASLSMARVVVFRLSRSRRMGDPYRHFLQAALGVVLAAMYLQPQRVASDGIFYFAPLHSIVVDGDLDFENEYRVLGAPEEYFLPTSTGRLPNHFSVGPAILWAPLYGVVHVLGLVGLFRPTGFGYPYFTAVATTTVVVGFLGVSWLYRLARRHFDAPVALVATLLLWTGSSHLWYMVFEPSMSHALAMATVCGLLLLSYDEELHRPAKSAALGAAAGLVALVRWQNVLVLPAAIALALSRQRKPSWRAWGIATLAAALVFLPQILYWKLIYDRFLLVPQGSGYLRWSSPELASVLFSSRHGLFSWTPLLWVGAAGLPRLFRKDRTLTVSLLAVFAASLYVNASVEDWWAGASFGARRFDALLPLFGLGLAAALEWMRPRVERHGLACAGLFLLPLVVWTWILMGVYQEGALPKDAPISFHRATADGAEIVYRRTGFPFSWPGALLEWLRRDLPPSAYDLAGARYRSNNVEIRMGDGDLLYLGAGWSLPRRGRGASYREVGPDGAFVYVALREPAPYELVVVAEADGGLAVEWNGQPVGGLDRIEGEAIAVEIPAHLVRAGVNRLKLAPMRDRIPRVRRILLRRPGEVP